MDPAFPENYKFDDDDVPPGRGWRFAPLIESLMRGATPDGFEEFFDRDPERTPPSDAASIVSPADGIVELEREEGKLRFVVHLRLTDVHVQRIPLAGKVLSVERKGSGFLFPDQDGYRFSVRTVTRIVSPVGIYEVCQMTSLISKRIDTYVRPDQVVDKGERLGRIRLGSTVILSLPAGVSAVARSGQKVHGGETVLARI